MKIFDFFSLRSRDDLAAIRTAIGNAVVGAYIPICPSLRARDELLKNINCARENELNRQRFFLKESAEHMHAGNFSSLEEPDEYYIENYLVNNPDPAKALTFVDKLDVRMC